jgi:hypothetical protein
METASPNWRILRCMLALKALVPMRCGLLPPMIALLLSLPSFAQQNPSAASADWSQDSAIKAEARVVSERYCEGDAGLFTVDLNFEIQISNNSKDTLFLRSDMVQSATRVAPDTEAARRGRYMYESGSGMSIWAADYKLPAVREIIILPGNSSNFLVDGGVVARYDPKFSSPKTVPPGRYAVQLLLRPEKEFPHFNHTELKSLAVDPVAIEIDEHPQVIRCR